MDRAGRSGTGWGTRLLIAFLLVLVGAAAAIWVLARFDSAAQVLGIAEPAPSAELRQEPSQQLPIVGDSETNRSAETLNPLIAEQIAQLQTRIQQVESETQEAQGSVGRADSLLIAFAARRALDRGVALGYLEPLLIDRFGPRHAQAVATIVSNSRSPVKLTGLIARYQDLEPELVGPPPDEDLWTGIKRGFSSLITVRRSDRSSTQPQARYDRALSFLMSGEVDEALAETMRLPGAPRAREWVTDARRYIATRRALDEIESAALVGTSRAVQPAS